MITATAPLPALLRSLRRAGYGDLRGRQYHGLVSTLDGLSALLPDKSAAGLVTVPQIADAANLSVRWTRTRLQVLEAAGIITWVRGGVIDGRPAPSWIRVSKTALIWIIRAARPALDAALAVRRAATAARLAAAPKLTAGRHRRRSVHGEVRASLLTPNGGGTPLTSPEKGTDMAWHLPVTCDHGGDAGVMRLKDGSTQPRCPICRQEQATKPKASPNGGVDHQALAAADDLWS